VKRTYGTIQLAGDFWNIEAEAHVVIRLKRLFGKLSKSAKSLSIRHTLDVARDLVWVMERYPLKASKADSTVLRKASDLHIERAERFVSVLTGAAEPRAFKLREPARDYQHVGADLALQQGGLLIADDVGTGKTCTAICMLTDPATRPALVVTLTHLPKQWQRELARFAPGLRTHVLKTTKPHRIPLCDVIITSYSKLSGWAPVLAGTMRSVVFDEIQELRHPTTERSTAAREIASGCAYRVGLSATPIFNYGNEFFNVVDVLRPGELGTKSEFLQEWCTEPDSKGKASVKDPKAFGAYLREQGMMIRRTRLDVGRELPGLTVVPHTVASGDVFDQLDKDGKGDITELARFILARDAGPGIEQLHARGELDWRMRQATGIAKAKYVAEFVRMLVDGGERVLLYGWHHAVYDIWCEKLKDLGVVKFTGEESPTQKEAAKAAFESGTHNVLIMSLRSGAGIDGLQRTCRTVVFGELDWSPAVHEQATGRIYRDGQSDPVATYFLVSEEGSDPVIQSVLGLKRVQLDGVRSPDKAIFETVKRGAITDLAKAVLARRARKQHELPGVSSAAVASPDALAASGTARTDRQG
jgi:SNF2 family DNA or RNA helicase